MKISDLLAPVSRSKYLFSILIIGFSVLFFWLFKFIPETQKTTIYFTIKQLELEEGKANPSLDPIEGATKVAETIAGWAKNPAFRQLIMDDAGVYIPKFKRKISARKQNRLNVFWTLKFSPEDQVHHQKITESTINIIKNSFAEFNDKNAFPMAMSEPQVFSEKQVIPQGWLMAVSIILALFIAFIFIYIIESSRGKVSFYSQIDTLFPQSPLIKLSGSIQNYNEVLLKSFLNTFENPVLLGTFNNVEDFFPTSELADIDHLKDFPILFLKLGATSLKDLENYKALFGDDLGLIVFEN